MVKTLPFKAYVLKQTPNSPLAQEFLKETKADAAFPNVGSWWDLRLYLLKRDGGEKAVVAARAFWKAYKKANV
ncbi:MAG TPA: hypothetical protein VGN12_29825 [Pirellulales bacterium]|jgi:hypothetical protein